MNKDKNFKIDFMGIGSPRCASCWIDNCLKDHHEITCLNATKFFIQDPIYQKGINYYKQQYPKNTKTTIKGEYDSGCLHQAKAAERIKKHFPNAKLIVCIRNPIERAYSHFLLHDLKGKNLNKSFNDFIHNPESRYIWPGFYAHHLKEYFKHFNKKQILVMIYEDIKKDPTAFIQKIYKFLEVDDNFIPETISKKVNYTGYYKPYSRFLNVIMFKSSRFFYKNPFLKKHSCIFKKLGLKKIRDWIKKNNKKLRKSKYQKPEMPQKDREFLRNLYQEDIKKLEKLIDRKLDFWK